MLPAQRLQQPGVGGVSVVHLVTAGGVERRRPGGRRASAASGVVHHGDGGAALPRTRRAADAVLVGREPAGQVHVDDGLSRQYRPVSAQQDCPVSTVLSQRPARVASPHSTAVHRSIDREVDHGCVWPPDELSTS